MHANIFSITYLIANAISLLVLTAAAIWPAVARLLLSLIFIGAALFNAVMAVIHPELFTVYGAMTPSPVYEEFIYGAFQNNITAIVMSISICQLATGFFIAAGGTLLKLGLFAAVFFLVAIAPLGAGSAFPSTLLLAAAAVILFFKTKYLNAHPVLFTLRHLFPNHKI